MRAPHEMQNGPASYPALTLVFGFVPNLFRAQGALPQAVAAEEQLIDVVVVKRNRVSRRQKECLLYAAASAWGNDYCRALFKEPGATSEQDTALLRFGRKLARHAPWFSPADISKLRGSGFDETAILESVVTTALGAMLCTLAEGLHPDPDPGLVALPASEPMSLSEPGEQIDSGGPYLSSVPHLPDNFPPYVTLREQFGFVAALFRAQSVLPDVIEAEVRALERILLPEDHLSRIQKENILLAVSSANFNTYLVAVHTQILSALGVSPEDSDQVVEDHRGAALSEADVALLHEARKLASPAAKQEGTFEASSLRARGFSEAQVVEAVAMSALANFLNLLQAGLGTLPDFPPRHVFAAKDLYPPQGPARPISDAPGVEDPDAPLVARVQNGDSEAFEDLVRRHSRRVLGTLAGIIGNMDDVRDATQDVFLKAFENIGRFQGRSKFSSWLVSIAVNTGTDILRQRRPTEPLEVEDDEGFRPRQIQSWTDNPEQAFAASQRDELVREGVLRLPQKYRVAVLLRDISQLSTEDAAAALGLSVPALKARLIRGRLMLRESLTPHFVRARKDSLDA
jgi:RNA polymerase sigma-70 factor (ECF subfamily)